MAAFATLGFTSGGCLAYKVVSAPVKLAATTVVVAGETAGAVVSSTGKLAVSAVNATGNVGSGGIDAASRLAQTGMVTFVDVASGSVVRIPWQEGLTLAGAGNAAKLDFARRAINVLRAGKVVYSASKLSGDGAALASGDVVRFGS
ncbi:MAG TPA: hypothetical protein VM029_12290 [Opitutaceae bacterium]|nr:hypothetical protein [Opitutaceae bacterium]